MSAADRRRFSRSWSVARAYAVPVWPSSRRQDSFSNSAATHMRAARGIGHVETRVTRLASRRRTSRERSECLLAHLHDRQVDACGNPALSTEPRQHVLDEKLCHSDLSGIERALGRCRSRSSVSSAIRACRSSSHPISVTDGEQEGHRLQTHPIELTSALLRIDQVFGHSGDHPASRGNRRVAPPNG